MNRPDIVLAISNPDRDELMMRIQLILERTPGIVLAAVDEISKFGSNAQETAEAYAKLSDALNASICPLLLLSQLNHWQAWNNLKLELGAAPVRGKRRRRARASYRRMRRGKA